MPQGLRVQVPSPAQSVASWWKKATLVAFVKGLEDREYIFEKLCFEKIRTVYRSRRDQVPSASVQLLQHNMKSAKIYSWYFLYLLALRERRLENLASYLFELVKKVATRCTDPVRIKSLLQHNERSDYVLQKAPALFRRRLEKVA